MSDHQQSACSVSINHYRHYYYCASRMPNPEGMQMKPAENSPLQWGVLLWPHLSCSMIDSDWLNCPENKAIHLENDMLQNLSAFHTVKKRGRLRSCLLQPLFYPRLPLIHINSQLWDSHMILHCPECLLDTVHACIPAAHTVHSLKCVKHKLTCISNKDFHEDNSLKRIGVLGKYSPSALYFRPSAN